MQGPGEDVIFVGIVGYTGSGKSTFINAVLGEDKAQVASGEYSCTKEVKGYDYTLPSGRRIVLVDTLGFDSCFGAKEQLLTSLNILKKMWEYVGVKFSYILVLQSVTCSHVHEANTSEKRTLKKLCPSNDKVFIVTTHWDVLNPTADEQMATEVEGKLSPSNCFLRHMEGKTTTDTYRRSGKAITSSPVPGYDTPRDIIHKLCEVEAPLIPAEAPPVPAKVLVPAEAPLVPAENQCEGDIINMPKQLDVRSNHLEEIASTLLTHQGLLTNLTGLVRNLGDHERIKMERDDALAQLDDLRNKTQGLKDTLASKQKELDNGSLEREALVLECENKLREKDKQLAFQDFIASLIRNIGDHERMKMKHEDTFAQLDDLRNENQRLKDALTSKQKELDNESLELEALVLECENKLREKDEDAERTRLEWERKTEERERELGEAHEDALQGLRSQAQEALVEQRKRAIAEESKRAIAEERKRAIAEERKRALAEERATHENRITGLDVRDSKAGLRRFVSGFQPNPMPRSSARDNLLSSFGQLDTAQIPPPLSPNISRLQYLLELQTAGMIDNPHCPLSTAQRREKLRNREEAWGGLKSSLQMSMPVSKGPSDLYDVTPTAFLLGVASEPWMLEVRSLMFGSDMETEPPTLLEVQIPKRNVGFGTSIEEHDLLAIVAINLCTPNKRFYLEITLLRHSTGKLHDEAQAPTLTVLEVLNMVSISIKISGENLALIVSDSKSSQCTFHLFNWKKGTRKGPANLPAPNLGLVFLREDLLLIPNILDPSFTLHYIPFSTPDIPDSRLAMHPLVKLSFPTLDQQHVIESLQIRCDPSPTAGGRYPQCGPTTRPFANDPVQAIIITEMGIRDSENRNIKRFLMFVHRKALIELLPEGWEEKVASELAAGITTELQSRASESQSATGVHEGWEDEDQWPEYHVHFESVVIGPLEGATTAAAVGIPLVPWADWGPPITRWLDGDKYKSCVTSTAGERFVCMQATEDLFKQFKIKVLDFNPYRVDKRPAPSRSYEESARSAGRLYISRRAVADDEVGEGVMEGCPTRGAFVGDVVESRLPFVEESKAEGCSYDDVFLDEQRIIGVKYDTARPNIEKHVVKDIEVIHYG